jgi:uncharacterized damage-inducible protein DinB
MQQRLGEPPAARRVRAPPAGGIRRAAHELLNHILTVDWFYLEMIERSIGGLPPSDNPGRHFDPEEPFDHCADLMREQRTVDARLVALCESIADEHLDATISTRRRQGRVHDRLRRILAHLFQHQIHHRGQVHAMLAGTSVQPPQLDEFFCTGEVALRAQDFAELGFSEEAIWGARAVLPLPHEPPKDYSR